MFKSNHTRLAHCPRQKVGAKLVFALQDAASQWATTRIAPTPCPNVSWSDLGQDTDQVMRDVLDYSGEQISRLKDEQRLY